jgi:hypothetical protein
MEKAFDVKVLMGKLKARGLDLAEDAAVIVIEETFDWTGESLALTNNKLDDVVIPFIPTLKAAALSQVDKLDGKVG